MVRGASIATLLRGAGKGARTCAKDVARHKERPDHEQAIDDVGLALRLAQGKQEPAHVHEWRAELPHQERRPCSAQRIPLCFPEIYRLMEIKPFHALIERLRRFPHAMCHEGKEV